MSLTAEAKKLLAETIRGTQQDPEKGLRAKLLRAIHDEADRRYRLSVPIQEAGLDEAHRRRRERIEAWIDERVRAAKAQGKTEIKAAKERLLAQAEKEAAATLINRLVLLRQLEALGLSKPAVLTGGWGSKGYREFREFAPTLCTNGTTDATEGYATLLQLVFDELAIDIPGLFGNVGLTRLFPIPAATLREVVERLDNPDIASAWTDDTTLGWVYQYWNDPDREALDAKINGGAKIEPHEIASKTQMFTERYMVEWLLHNSLGLTWLCMCKKHGWAADAERVLPVLDARRAQWRRKRDAGEVALDALMPIESELEDQWKYYVPQPLPEDAVEKAPASVREIKLLDPACGSGHFLVIAFDLLAAMYREEARSRGQSIADREIAESILEYNLHGIDIDPRAIQIAAAALYLKARAFVRNARPKRINLVAPVLQLGNLPPDDPAVVHLREDLNREAGIPDTLTNKLLGALAGVDYLGSLLKLDAAVEEALQSVELGFEQAHGQGDLFSGFPAQRVQLSMSEATVTVLDRLELFLSTHSKSEDLGLRLDGEQFAAGVRFVRMVKDGTYDLVVGNPPYQGLSKTAAFEYVSKAYPRAKADLYAAFLDRGIQLAREGGISALLTMRGWMFLGQFAELRQHVLGSFDLRCLGDFDRGAFDEVPNEVLAVSAPIIRNVPHGDEPSVALQPTPLADKSYDRERTKRKRAAVLAHVGRHEFDPRAFAVIEGAPVVYWWLLDLLHEYVSAPKLGAFAPIRQGLKTSNNVRFIRRPWECREIGHSIDCDWAPCITGAEGRAWFDELSEVILWRTRGLELRVMAQHLYGSYTRTITSESFYFRSGGVALAMIGNHFTARLHRYPSVFTNAGSSLFTSEPERVVCSLNSSRSRSILLSINPTINSNVGDVARLPLFHIPAAKALMTRLRDSFERRERTREPAAEFVCPGPSDWASAQQWVQSSVDSTDGEGRIAYNPVDVPADPSRFVSFAVGVVLGRFGAAGEGALHEAADSALQNGILFLSSDGLDSLEDSASGPLKAIWEVHGRVVGDNDDLRTYLRKSFIELHRRLYDNRPIYFPLSSAKKSFVAFISIHRWKDDTLNSLLADHLVPTRRRLDGELEDLRNARASGTNKGKAEKRFAEVQKLLGELNEFIAKVTEVAEEGPPPPDDKTPKREVDARYVMDLDDGVMVNSAALWPLLEPQWKDPKKWWKELATAQGKKNYDWSHLAARYFPTRVREKCHDDPSLAVAHKCFWELHPGKAYAWEVRLQDEIRPDFTIDEPGSDAARAKFLAEHGAQAAEIRENEMKRRARKATKAEDESESGPLFDADAEGAEEAQDE